MARKPRRIIRKRNKTRIRSQKQVRATEYSDVNVTNTSSEAEYSDINVINTPEEVEYSDFNVINTSEEGEYPDVNATNPYSEAFRPELYDSQTFAEDESSDRNLTSTFGEVDYQDHNVPPNTFICTSQFDDINNYGVEVGLLGCRNRLESRRSDLNPTYDSCSNNTGYSSRDFYNTYLKSDNPTTTATPSNNNDMDGGLWERNRNLILSCIVIIVLIIYLVRNQGQQTTSSLSRTTERVNSPTKVLGLVGVPTTYLSADRRAALRTTWFPSDQDPHHRENSLAFVFVIGKTKGNKMREVEKENDIYGDILILEEGEQISPLEKILAFFKAGSKKFDAEYYIKAGDHIYLRPDRLAILLSKKKTKSLEYIGCEKSERLKKNKDMVYAHGSIYILSAKAVQPLANVRTGGLPKSLSEDFAIGYLMDILSVQFEENIDLCQSQCTRTSIAVWNFSCSSGPCNPDTKLKELHKSSMCSETPTIQSDLFDVQ